MKESSSLSPRSDRHSLAVVEPSVCANREDQDIMCLSGARANAVTHGLTASKLLPDLLQPGRVFSLMEQLRQEHRPATLVEELVLREIARHAAMLEIAEQAEGAVLRQGALGLTGLIGSGDPGQDDDMVLAAAVTTDPAERLTRYRRAHEKSLHQALQKLRELQQSRHKKLPAQTMVPMDRFATEEACKGHLRARFSSSDWKCPACLSPRGHWITARDVWQCAKCGKQISLRHGTVMEGSPLPLSTWFAAIRYVVADTAMTCVTLSRLVSIRRAATAQSMLRRIRQAVMADDAEAQLAGLSAYPLSASH
jgi:transposase-like protein